HAVVERRCRARRAAGGGEPGERDRVRLAARNTEDERANALLRERRRRGRRGLVVEAALGTRDAPARAAVRSSGRAVRRGADVLGAAAGVAAQTAVTVRPAVGHDDDRDLLAGARRGETGRERLERASEWRTALRLKVRRVAHVRFREAALGRERL